MSELTIVRQYLHQHPECSQQERNTQKYLLGLIEKLNVDKVEKIAETGILLIFYGKENGINILFRGDIDALPIEETIETSYRSDIAGVAHKCGHDGHTTILYGLAKHFSSHKPEKGNMYLLFQPAEENGYGAKAVVDSGKLNELSIDLVFALHNLPGYAKHHIVCREGSFTSSVVSIAAHFKGYTAHAAEPWNGRNPAKAMSEYLLAALQHNHEDVQKHEYITISPVYSLLGSKNYGIAAGEGTIHLTVRADIPERLATTTQQLEMIAKRIAEKEELSVSFEYIEPFDANINVPKAVKIIKESASYLKLIYEDRPEPFRWGEDFGLLTNLYPGAMFGLGAGENCPPLHHPAYDYPDDITQTGIDMFITIQNNAQES